jgi:predicted NodU family carbamoyl transferase
MSMSKPIYILGTGVLHDGSSSSLLKDSKILVTHRKERLTKKNRSQMSKLLAVKYLI